jgi:flagellar biosynthetic protein FliO
MRRFLFLLGIVATTVAPILAAAPVGAAPSDSIVIRSTQGGPRVTSTQPVAMPSLGVDITRMLLALAIVIGLIYVSRWLLKRFYGGGATAGGSRVVQVLNRTPLAPRQQVMLLQVGRRVVVVGESNGNMVTLAQIDDPDEIAQLIGRLHEERSGRSMAFGGLFGHAQAKMERDVSEDDVRPASSAETNADSSSEEVKSDLTDLLEKVRSIRNQMGRQ